MNDIKQLQAYKNFILFEKRLSDHTVKSYLRDIDMLIQHNKGMSLEGLKSNNIRTSIASLHARGLSSNSLSRILSSWKGLFVFLVDQHHYKHNPVLEVKAPKKSKKLPQTLSVDQAIKLVNISGSDFISLRDHAILELFYSSGLRLSELVNLKLEDINFSDEIITVFGKGKKMRIVPVGSAAIQSLKKWIKIRSQLKNVNSNLTLFLTKQTKKLTQRAVQYRLKFWAKKQGVSENIHPHLLRHSFASHLLQSSQDLRAVQELLGHENISSTQIYTHLDFQHLSRTYDQAHPRAKKNKKR
jgi:integrase/recombinase XerC